METEVRGANRQTAGASSVAETSSSGSGWPCRVKAMNEITLNKPQRMVTASGQTVRLSPLEFDLLEALATGFPGVVGYRRLLESVWGTQASAKLNYLKLYIHYLRSRLEENPSSPRLIVTERSRGYRLTAPVTYTGSERVA